MMIFHPSNTTALILTAGYSRRMGQAKAWLQYNGQSFLSLITQHCLKSSIFNIIIVVGCDSSLNSTSTPTTLVSKNDVNTHLHNLNTSSPALNLKVIVGKPNATSIDSIRVGLPLKLPHHHLLLWPIDNPFVDSPLLTAMHSRIQNDNIVMPVYNGKRCHPVLLGAQVADELYNVEADKGANGVVNKDRDRIKEISSNNSKIAWQLNTHEQARSRGIVLL